MKTKILVVDDEKDMTRLLQRTLEPEIDCRVSMAFSGKMAQSILEQEQFDLIICDIKMPGMDGFELLEYINKNFPELTVIMLTAYGNIESAVKAIKKGAYDFVPKPFELDEIVFKIRKALERSLLIKENKRLIKENRTGQKLIGKSEPMLKVFDQINLVASSDVTVLITGESGTGKDIVARSIHALSPRKGNSFIPVNCPTIPENILESELFGYKKGAFTNASADKEGIFQEADKGTIFLDEIGDIGPSIQTKLLRVLQEKEIKPLGDTKILKVDVRIIASTNRDLEQKIADNEFREDFFYRLNVLPIELPPLRDRVTDIPFLAEHLIHKHCDKLKKEHKVISEDVMDLLMKHSWPGNIRELENILVQGILYSKSNVIELVDIPLNGNSKKRVGSKKLNGEIGKLPYKEAKEIILHEFNHDYIGAKLSINDGNITHAAKQSSMDRQALQQIMKRFGINPDNFR
ncbi:MAG: sigma-54-dependent Fis family transcriptional regulator [Desulfobacterales bacterium]|nr:sigma-54-dependent Fis family transcriptional regulator [Desulfobacterales bacterium]MCP4161980.1 sigma-54-dependent Fis family transcriptional regulator [Deltaproteobacteria bacterium]